MKLKTATIATTLSVPASMRYFASEYENFEITILIHTTERISCFRLLTILSVTLRLC